MRRWKHIYYSFPIQLLFLHLKKNYFLLFFLVLLAGYITNLLGSRYGIALLFLDPEYLGQVDFISFFILGLALGGLFIVWSITSYILNAHHFPFLATLSRPFGVYALNNSVLPFSFFVVYLAALIHFQLSEGLLSITQSALRLTGLFSGIILFIFTSMVYFFRTNKNIFQIIGISNKAEGTGLITPFSTLYRGKRFKDALKVESYFNHDFQLKLARPVHHYPEEVIRSVYRQHHANALFIQLSGLLMIIIFGHLVDYPFFRIPAASSIILLCSMLIVIAGAFTYWLGQWKVITAVLLIILLDFIIGLNFLQYKNRAMGLNYKEITSPYTIEQLKAVNNIKNIHADIESTTAILENWKNKFDSTSSKPKMIFINCSGGGLRATMFTMKVLQKADSITHGSLMNNTVLITGASGGMIAAAYYRELYYRMQTGDTVSLFHPYYLQKISSDLLNAVSFSLVVNDLFYPVGKLTYNDNVFRKDRGYIFEKVLHENTDSIMHKPISAYRKAEEEATIPMVLFSPTIINDERKLFIGTQKFSYLTTPVARLDHFTPPEMDGIDIHDLLGNAQADNLLFSTAIRMNCTFPYILPNVHFPTMPSIELMDAGIRDNFGIENSVRFAATFADWIKDNTSGVIMVNIRGLEQERPIKNKISQGVDEKIFSPIGNLYVNWVEIQDYQNDFALNYLHQLLSGKLEVITFEYQSPENRKRASLSLHLTAREKQDIISAAENMHNDAGYRKLKRILGYN